MRNLQKTFYKIGHIFNFIFLALWIVLLVINIVNGATNNALNPTGIAYFVFMIIVAIACLIITSVLSKKAKDENNTNSVPIIILIVVGLVSYNVFFAIGGVFGIIAINQMKEAEKREIEQKEKEAEEEAKAKEEERKAAIKPLSWYDYSINSEDIDKCLCKDKYLLDDQIWDEVKMMSEDEDSTSAMDYTAFGIVAMKKKLDAVKDPLPTDLFNSFLTELFEEIDKEGRILYLVQDLLVFNIRFLNCPYFIKPDTGDFIELKEVLLPNKSVFSRTENIFLKYIDLFMERVGNHFDDTYNTDLVYDLEILMNHCISFISDEFIHQKSNILEDNPWLYDRNTFFVAGNQLRTEDQFIKKCRALTNNPKLFK